MPSTAKFGSIGLARALAALCLVVVAPAESAAQQFNIRALVTSRSARPDGGLFFRCLQPSIEGDLVVFRAMNTGTGLTDSIWSANLTDSSFRKLVGSNTPAPDGSGNFTEFYGAAPILRDGVAIFAGQDSSKRQFRDGVYIVPAAGGAVQKIANYNTSNPSGGRFMGLGQPPHSFWHSSGNVIFTAVTAAGQQAIYLTDLAGGDAIIVADGQDPILASNVATFPSFSNPSLQGDRFAFGGESGGDPVSASTAVFSGRLGAMMSEESGRASLSLVVGEQTPLPGNANKKPRTRILLSTIQLDGESIVFSAADENSGFTGVFVVPIEGGGLRRVVSSADSLPGLGKLDGTRSFTGLASRGGQIVFTAEDVEGKSGLFLFADGFIARVMESGDIIAGQAVRFFGDLSGAALDQGRIVFWASLEVGGPGMPDEVLAVASKLGLPGEIRAVRNAASFAEYSVAPGELITVTGPGIGPSRYMSFQIDSGGRMTTELEGTRILFNGKAAPLLSVDSGEIKAFIPFDSESGSAAEIVVESQGTRSSAVALPVDTTSPGLFAVNNAGFGQGAIVNEDGSTNSIVNPARAGSTIALFGTGAGLTDPAGIDGSTIGQQAARPLSTVSAAVGGRSAEVAYFGSGAVAGIFQANVVIPSRTVAGMAPVVLTVGKNSTQANLLVSVK